MANSCTYCGSSDVQAPMFGGAELPGAPDRFSIRKFCRCRSCGEFFEPPLDADVIVLINLLLIAGLAGGFYFAPFTARLVIGALFGGMVMLSVAGLLERRDPPVTSTSLTADLQDALASLRADTSPRPLFDLATRRPARALIKALLLLGLVLPVIGLVVFYVIMEEPDLTLDVPLALVSALYGGSVLLHLAGSIRHLRTAGSDDYYHFRAGTKGIAVRTVDDRRVHLFALRHRLISTTIPWSQIRGVRAYVFSTNGFRQTAYVLLETPSGDFKLSDLPFAEGCEQIASNLRALRTFLRTHQLGG